MVKLVIFFIYNLLSSEFFYSATSTMHDNSYIFHWFVGPADITEYVRICFQNSNYLLFDS